MAADSKADEALYWNSVMLDAVRRSSTPPPVAARMMAIVSIAAYDAGAAVSGAYQPVTYHQIAPIGASQVAAVGRASYETLKSLFPTQAAMLDAKFAERQALWGNSDSVIRGDEVGRASAGAVLESRRNDGAATAGGSTPYTGSNEPGRWRPTSNGLSGLLPLWGQVKTFVVPNGASLRPDSTPTLTDTSYATAFDEVRMYGSRLSAVRTAEQTEIAKFWAGGGGTATPPGQWNRIASTVAVNQGNDLNANLRMFGMLNSALADAGIVSWDCKYTMDFWRPETAIRFASTDGNPNTTQDADWTPLLGTPNFPSMTSGHSTFSAAAATTLAQFFGTDALSFSEGGEGVGNGIQRSFTSLRAAALEAGQSRIYGGIHFQFDNTVGLAMGERIGQTLGQSGAFAAVPEPATLVGLGLAGLVAGRRRRRA